MTNVLVLNYDFTPINITTIKRGFVLVDKGKAEVIKSDKNPIIAGYKTYVRPLIIRLLNYVKYTINSIKPSRKRIYRRDGFKCVYCGSTKDLTIDHVIPKSRGGNNDWLNLVSSCVSCNLKKGNRTPEEANMTMIKLPTKMTFKQFGQKIIKDTEHTDVTWNEYVKSIKGR